MDFAHHLIHLIPDGLFGIVDGLTRANEADLTLDIGTGGLGDVDLTAGLRLHLFDSFTTYHMLALISTMAGLKFTFANDHAYSI